MIRWAHDSLITGLLSPPSLTDVDATAVRVLPFCRSSFGRALQALWNQLRQIWQGLVLTEERKAQGLPRLLLWQDCWKHFVWLLDLLRAPNTPQRNGVILIDDDRCPKPQELDDLSGASCLLNATRLLGEWPGTLGFFGDFFRFGCVTFGFALPNFD